MQSSSAIAARLGEQFADLETGPTMPLERKRRRQQASRSPFGAQIHRIGTLPGIAPERWLRIEQIDLRRAARHEQDNAMLRPGGKVRRRRAGRPRLLIRQHAGKRDRPQTRSHGTDHFTPRNRLIHGQKITSLVQSSACAKSVIVPLARYAQASASSRSPGSRASALRYMARTFAFTFGLLRHASHQRGRLVAQEWTVHDE